MSPQPVLVFIARGLTCTTRMQLALSCFPGLSWVKKNVPEGKLSASLEQSLDLVWEDVYDFVDPFGDRRGCLFDSVWIFDLNKDLLFLRKNYQTCFGSLELARERLLTLDDFKLLNSPRLLLTEEQNLPEPYWEPNLYPIPRVKSFLGKLLRDFAYTWRHVLRRPMNTMTFMKLAYATIWISTMDFIILERMGFEHVSSRGPYVDVVDLPAWEAPGETLVQAGSSWFALAQDTRGGLNMVQRHMTSHSEGSATNVRTYAILTLRHIVLCKARGSELVWTRSETLFRDDHASDAAIDMILWATNTTSTERKPSAINSLPVEIQDKILYYATTSSIASAKLGCKLGAGSPFPWVDSGLQITLQEVKRHRMESSPIESQIFFGGVMSGLSYKQERRDRILPVSRTLVSTPGQA
ncbi:hypothetical protein C2857_007893 [Epichloe festucae Fl1]|uniref:Uncharacterized protein n=1 Tax=Epichloe festucae (strain Fl1) TaxID=877507 RepID=A0A7S9KR29_EPIFF|nr:hypothetical protein C2857_007893 [Epichloe festucae Fl1]